jgi:hypothetical protein
MPGIVSGWPPVMKRENPTPLVGLTIGCKERDLHMAEHEEDGRQFSKRQNIFYKDGEDAEVEKLKQEHGFPEPDFTRDPQDIEKVLEAFRRHAVSVLEEYGLPEAAPFFYRCRSGNWRPAWLIVATGGRLPRKGEIRTLEEHVHTIVKEREVKEGKVKKRKKYRDSAPDLAARVLSGLYSLEQAKTREEIVSAALWLGFDVALAGGYQAESEKMSSRGTLSGGNAEWAELLADHYKKEGIERSLIKSGEGIHTRLKKDKGLRINGWFISAEGDVKDEKKNKRFRAMKAGEKKHRKLAISTFYQDYWVGK